jgi:hypothetical protein
VTDEDLDTADAGVELDQIVGRILACVRDNSQEKQQLLVTFHFFSFQRLHGQGRGKNPGSFDFHLFSDHSSTEPERLTV